MANRPADGRQTIEGLERVGDGRSMELVLANDLAILANRCFAHPERLGGEALPTVALLSAEGEPFYHFQL